MTLGRGTDTGTFREWFDLARIYGWYMTGKANMAIYYRPKESGACPAMIKHQGRLGVREKHDHNQVCSGEWVGWIQQWSLGMVKACGLSCRNGDGLEQESFDGRGPSSLIAPTADFAALLGTGQKTEQGQDGTGPKPPAVSQPGSWVPPAGVWRDCLDEGKGSFPFQFLS